MTSQPGKPLISVCIANFNGMDVIDDCLRSVQEQTGDLAVEIIVHDDASTDGSSGYIRASHPEVVLLESQENTGFCISNNRMAAHARGEYILLLNNDAALFPDALTTLKMEAKRIGRPAILGLPQFDYETGVLLDIGSLCDPFLNPVPNLDAARRDVAMVSGACLWIPRALWEELGGFPDWFGSLAEDMYLCSLARLAGHPVQALDTSGFRHHVGKTLGGGKVTKENRLATSIKRRTLTERNKSFVMLLTYPAPLFQLILPLHLVLLVLEGATLALIKREWALFRDIYLSCLYALLQRRERLFLLRQKIQAKRKIGLRQYWSVFQLMPHKLRMLFRHGLPKIK